MEGETPVAPHVTTDTPLCGDANAVNINVVESGLDANPISSEQQISEKTPVETLAVLEESALLTESQASTDVSGDSADELEKGPENSSLAQTELSETDEIATQLMIQEAVGETISINESEVVSEATVEIMDVQESEEAADIVDSGNKIQANDEKENGDDVPPDMNDENGAEPCVEITRRRTSNDREGHCYCGKERNLNIVELLCAACNRWHHESCVGRQIGKNMPFMTNYTFVCKNCSPNGLEFFKRSQPSMMQLCITALACLTQQSIKDGACQTLFSRDEKIIPFFEMHSESLIPARRITQTWASRVTKALNGKEASQHFAMDRRDDPGSPYYGLLSADLTQIHPNYDDMIKGGSLKVTDGSLQAGNTGFGRRGAKRRIVGDALALTQASVAKKSRGDALLPKLIGHGYPVDHPYNKDGYRYILAEPDSNAPYRQEFDESNDSAGKMIPSWLYRVSNPTSVLLALHDRAPQLKVSEDRLSVTGEKGYCMIRATHGVTQGSWYWEAQITDQPEGSHTRMGFSQMFGNLQGPLGYDRFGYSWRSRYGTKFHEARGKTYCKGGYQQGDILGFLIEMPDTNAKVPLVPCSYKDRPLVRFKSHLYYEDKDEKNMENDPTKVRLGSKISFFKNGVCQGVAFENIREGVYYPAVSLYKSCKVTVNFGPDFWNEPSQDQFPHKGMYERAEEAIIDQTLSDMLFLTENYGKLHLNNL